jgi:hypothetical protein
VVVRQTALAHARWAAVPPDTKKTCNTCHATKLISEFGNPDQGKCRSCRRARDREIVREKTLNDPEYREKEFARRRGWQERVAAAPKSEVAEKTCKSCGRTKPITEFHKNRIRKDGHHSWCRQCSRERQRLLRNPEKTRRDSKSHHARYKDDPVYRAKKAEIARKWHQDQKTHKTCTKCGAFQPLTNFHKNTATKDSRQGWCKPCMLVAGVASRRSRLGRDPEYREAYYARQRAKQQAKKRGYTISFCPGLPIDPEKLREFAADALARMPQGDYELVLELRPKENTT